MLYDLLHHHQSIFRLLFPQFLIYSVRTLLELLEIYLIQSTLLINHKVLDFHILFFHQRTCIPTFKSLCVKLVLFMYINLQIVNKLKDGHNFYKFNQQYKQIR